MKMHHKNIHASLKKPQEDNWVDSVWPQESRNDTKVNDSGQKQSIQSAPGCELEQRWEGASLWSSPSPPPGETAAGLEQGGKRSTYKPALLMC